MATTFLSNCQVKGKINKSPDNDLGDTAARASSEVVSQPARASLKPVPAHRTALGNGPTGFVSSE